MPLLGIILLVTSNIACKIGFTSVPLTEYNAPHHFARTPFASVLNVALETGVADSAAGLTWLPLIIRVSLLP